MKTFLTALAVLAVGSTACFGALPTKQLQRVPYDDAKSTSKPSQWFCYSTTGPSAMSECFDKLAECSEALSKDSAGAEPNRFEPCEPTNKVSCYQLISTGDDANAMLVCKTTPEQCTRAADAKAAGAPSWFKSASDCHAM